MITWPDLRLEFQALANKYLELTETNPKLHAFIKAKSEVRDNSFLERERTFTVEALNFFGSQNPLKT